MFDIDNPFAMVAVIMVSVGFMTVMTAYFKFREGRGGPDSREQEERLRRAEAEIERLSDRVKTLERLATDPEQRLRQDFSQLA